MDFHEAGENMVQPMCSLSPLTEDTIQSFGDKVTKTRTFVPLFLLSTLKITYSSYLGRGGVVSF